MSTVSVIYLYESICGIDASDFENVNRIYFLAINAPLTKSRQCRTGASAQCVKPSQVVFLKVRRRLQISTKNKLMAKMLINKKPFDY